MNATKIEWTEKTLNPVVGCTFGCPYCYARTMNRRFHYIENFAKPEFFPERLKQLYSKKPQIIFMDSMSDIADWEDDWIVQTCKAMGENPQHFYLFLTKRMSRFTDRDYCLWNNRKIKGEEIDRAWFGVSVTTQTQVPRCFNDSGDFLSIEPILEPISLRAAFVGWAPEWVIIGAETGGRKNKVVPRKEWIDSIVSECDAQGVPVFMKNSLTPVMGEGNMRREFPKELR